MQAFKYLKRSCMTLQKKKIMFYCAVLVFFFFSFDFDCMGFNEINKY